MNSTPDSDASPEAEETTPIADAEPGEVETPEPREGEVETAEVEQAAAETPEPEQAEVEPEPEQAEVEPEPESEPIEPDARLFEAHDLALAALREITPEATIGAAAGYVVEPGGVVSLRFENRLAGYPGWFWTVTVGVVEGSEPTVLETELMPGDGALLAPDWVPWAERLADYQAAQAALAEAERDRVSDETADLDDVEDLDASDFDDDGSPILHAGDVDGVDIDELAEDDEDDDEDDLDDDDDEFDESDDEDGESDDEDDDLPEGLADEEDDDEDDDLEDAEDDDDLEDDDEDDLDDSRDDDDD